MVCIESRVKSRKGGYSECLCNRPEFMAVKPVSATILSMDCPKMWTRQSACVKETMMNKNTVQLFSTSMFRSLCSVLCALTLLIALPNLAISQTRPADKPDSAIDQLKDLAEKGSAEAQTKLADLYREGEKVAQDLQKSAEYYKKAADQGFAEAQYKLGKLYMEAKGLAQKPDEAFDWMKKAADQGFTAAKQKIDELAVKTRESMEGVIKPIKPPEPPADKKGQ